MRILVVILHLLQLLLTFQFDKNKIFCHRIFGHKKLNCLDRFESDRYTRNIFESRLFFGAVEICHNSSPDHFFSSIRFYLACLFFFLFSSLLSAYYFPIRSMCVAIFILAISIWLLNTFFSAAFSLSHSFVVFVWRTWTWNYLHFIPFFGRRCDEYVCLMCCVLGYACATRTLLLRFSQSQAINSFRLFLCLFEFQHIESLSTFICPKRIWNFVCS